MHAKKFLCSFFLLVLYFCLPLHAAAKPKLIINIVNVLGGKGLTTDYQIIKEELESLGHTVNLVSPFDTAAPLAHVNIFCEIFNPSFVPQACLNWFIPNPEWCFESAESIQRFDLILCRTKEVKRIFTPLNPHTYFLGFTSKDRYQPDIPKDYSTYLHLAGGSMQKGTSSILKAWGLNTDFPPLILIKFFRPPRTNLPNVSLIKEKVPEETLIYLQNSCGVHLCLSETEGFGHYINEAMAVGAVVVTTDAPPMNEFIHDPRCLVKYNDSGSQNFAVNYYVDPNDLTRIIKNLKRLSSEELKSIGKVNRMNYLKNRYSFKRRFRTLMDKTLVKLSN